MSMVSYVCLRRLGTSVATAPYLSLASPHTSSLARENLNLKIDDGVLQSPKFNFDLPIPQSLPHSGRSLASKSIVESQLFEPLTRSENLVVDNDVYHCCSAAGGEKVYSSLVRLIL